MASGGSEESSGEVRFQLREIIRQEVNQQRKEDRYAALDRRRQIEKVGFVGKRLSPSDVKALAMRIKKKQGGKEGCYKDLYSLQNALSSSGKENGEAFVKVDGSIAALVRNVSGHDSSLQLRATYCCANLSMAGPDIGLKVAKAVTPYLMNHLQGMNQILLEASLWAVGSLAASGMLAYKVLEVQGIYPQLISIMQCYSLPICAGSSLQEKTKVKLENDRVIEALLYASSHCVSAGLQDNSKLSEIEELVTASVLLLSRVDSFALPRLAYLFFLLSCSEASNNVFLKSDFLLKMVLLLDETLLVVIDLQNDLNTHGFSVQVITFIVRVLGNMCSLDLGRTLLENISTIACPIICHLIKTLIYLPSYIIKEVLWFVMQLLKPYSQWNNGSILVCDCPWTLLMPEVNLCLEQQSKKLQTFSLPVPTEMLP